eukprot:m51a1_g14818 hypothetical protein (704) ;mRNA; r:630202-632445
MATEDNKALADKAKCEGNKHLQEGRVDEAIASYTAAIALDPANHLYRRHPPPPRSRNSPASPNFPIAPAQQPECVRLAPSFAKGHWRRYHSLCLLGRRSAARDALSDGVARAGAAPELLDPLCQLDVEHARGAGSPLAGLSVPQDALDVARPEHRALLARVCAALEAPDEREAGLALADALAGAQGAAEALGSFAPLLAALLAACEGPCGARALGVLSSLSMRSEGARAALMKAGLPDAVVRLLGSPAAGALLAEALPAGGQAPHVADCVRALDALASESPAVRAALAASRDVVAALAAYLGLRGLCGPAADALATLVEESAARDAFFAGLDGAPLVVAAIDSQELSTDDRRGAVALLAALAASWDQRLDACGGVAAAERLLFAPEGADAEPARAEAASFFAELGRARADATQRALERALSQEWLAALRCRERPARRRAVAAVVSRLSSRDGVMERLYRELQGDLLDWARDAADPELQVAGFWALGNVARRDDIVETLVQRGAARLALDALAAAEPQSRVSASAAGALRNLCVPRGVKERLAAAGAVEELCELLPRLARVNAQAALFDAVVCLSLLTRGSAERGRRVVDHPHALETVCAVSRGRIPAVCAVPEGEPTQFAAMGPDGQRDLRVQYEAGRVVAELCAQQGADAARQMAQLGALEALALLLGSRFEVLQREARAAVQAMESHGISVVLPSLPPSSA